MSQFTDQELTIYYKLIGRHTTLHALFSDAELERLKFMRWLIDQHVFDEDMKEAPEWKEVKSENTPDYSSV